MSWCVKAVYAHGSHFIFDRDGRPMRFNTQQEAKVAAEDIAAENRRLTETKGWALCENLRTYGAESFTFGVLEVIRGKSQAHARETEIINSVRPALNTFQSRASM